MNGRYERNKQKHRFLPKVILNIALFSICILGLIWTPNMVMPENAKETQATAQPADAIPEIPSFEATTDFPEKSDFSISYDPEKFEMVVQEGAAYIRPLPVLPNREEIRENNRALLEGLSAEESEAEIDRLLSQSEEFYNTLPVCELEIVHLEKIPPDEAAADAQAAMYRCWESISEISAMDAHDGLVFSVFAGSQWNALVADMYFLSDGQGGTYRLTSRYYMEATEGFGFHFLTMVNSFTLQ